MCLQKAIATANKRLAHQADRLGLKSTDGNGPIGVGVAVVRGNEMYVATVGPAEAYLIRQARLSTLPDPHRERGLPAGTLEPDVWRGEISVGDSLVLDLAQRHRQARPGRAQGRDARPSTRSRRWSTSISGSWRRTAPGATARSPSRPPRSRPRARLGRSSRSAPPSRWPERRSGRRSRSPTTSRPPAVAVTAAAGTARVAAGGALERTVARIQDLMPRRRPAYRRVTPLASRRETQRRAALAVLALVIVVGGLGLAVYAFGGNAPQQAISSANAGQKALDSARADLAKVSGPGVDLVADDPKHALDVLTHAYSQLETAEEAKVNPAVIAPLRSEVVAGLDRLYGVVPVGSATAVHLHIRPRAPPRSTSRRWSSGLTASPT